MASKPIRVFYSELSGRFYASAHYREEHGNNGLRVIITGKKYDVTDDIARAVVEHELEFTPISDSAGGEG
jgi:hypothetical protein